MRFRRSTGVTSRAGATYKGETPQGMRRRRILRAVLTLVFFAAVILGIDFVISSSISADGIVVGDLGSIAPVAQGRIAKLNKQCLDHVSTGDVVATIADESTAATASQEIAQFNIDLSESKSDEAIAKTDAAAAQSYVQSLQSLTAQLAEVYKAETKLGKYVSSLDLEQAKAALDQAVANEEASEYLVQSKQGDGDKASKDVGLIAARIAAFNSTPALSGTYNLVAPKSGYLIECSAVVGSVVNVGTSLYSIYNPDDSYVVAFFDPSDAARLYAGDTVSVTISGLDGTVTGKIAGSYPEQSALPDALTRYFWQDLKWSQYVPIRVNLSGLSELQLQKVYSSAEASVTTWRPPKTGILGRLTRLFGNNPA